MDDKLRVLLRVPVSASLDGNRTEIVVWIDTAFNGGLVIPRKQIAEWGLVKGSAAEAILADGHSVEMETFACLFDWFSNTYETQIVQAMESIHCWERCSWTAIAWTLTTKRKRSLAGACTNR